MSQQLLSRALVSINWLAGTLKTNQLGSNLRVLDASFYYPPIRHGRKEYVEKHIPGALYFDIDECKDQASPFEVMLPSESVFANYVGNLGINNDSHVVIYDADQVGIYYAARVWWMFKVFGHKKVFVLNGGFRNWVKEGHPVTSEVIKPQPETYQAMLNSSAVKKFEDVQRNLNSKEFQLVDSRPEGRYRGTEPEPGEGILGCCSAPPEIEEKRKVTAIENKTDQFYRGSKHSGGHTLSSKKKISQEAVDICQLDTMDLIPTNIRHKYGSSLVEQLISPEQVQNYLRDVEQRTRNMPRVTLKHANLKPWLMEEHPHRIYYELSHCLRSNVFPGMPIRQHSLVHDSYTAEVNKRGRLDKGNSQHWYGRKTDDLALWSQKLMERNAITKILESQQNPSSVFPLRVHPKVPKDDPPPPAPPAKKPKKQQQAKAKKPKAPTALAIQPNQDDDFWDFYDKPIP